MLFGNKLFENGKLLKDVNYIKTFFWKYKYRLFSVPIILYPQMYFRIGSNVKIINNKGRLRLGCRWDMETFRQSQFIIGNNGILEINGNFDIYTGAFITVDHGGKLKLGRGYANSGVRLLAFNSISLGDNVVISDNSTIRDSDNHWISGGSGQQSAPIVIGNNVWIGMNVTVLKGVTIGDGAVVAAHSLVNKSVPPGTLVGGVPAKVIREKVAWKLS